MERSGQAIRLPAGLSVCAALSVLVGMLLAGSVPAGAAATGTGVVSESGSSVALGSVSIAFNVYSQDVVNQVLDPSLLRPHIRSGDVFVLVSGNSSGAPDLGWIDSAAAALHQAFPGNGIRILTSGQANIQQLAQNHAQVPSYIRDIGYDYEPGRANEPEFTWDFAATNSNFATAAGQAQAGGFQLFSAPTGRALLQASLQSYNWNYAQLVRSAAGQIVQLQTYCKSGGAAQYLAAVTKLRDQATVAGVPLGRFFPQVTVDSNASQNVNGVTPAQARDCAQQAADQGFGRISLWWGSDDVTDPQGFLALLGR
jgi:hypothetical protein